MPYFTEKWRSQRARKSCSQSKLCLINSGTTNQPQYLSQSISLASEFNQHCPRSPISKMAPGHWENFVEGSDSAVRT